MDLLSPPSTDLSVQIMSQIFGVGWQNLYQGGDISGNAAILASMFQTFNTVILTGLSVYFVYVFTIAVVGTSTEGTPMGRQYTMPYAPFRAASSTALLAPLPWMKGFCLMQALILMAISWSFGAADALFNKGIDYMNDNPAELAAEQAEGGRPLAAKIFQSLVLRGYLANQQGYPVSDIKWVQTHEAQKATSLTSLSEGLSAGSSTQPSFTSGEPAQYTLTFAMDESVGLEPDDLGKVVVGCVPPDSGGVDMCTAQMQAVNAMLATLAPAASRITADVNGLTDLSGNNAVTVATSKYNQVISSYAQSLLSQQNQRLIQELDKFTKDAKAKGWLVGGQFYWHKKHIEERVREATSFLPTYEVPNTEQLAAVSGESYQGYMNAAARYAYGADSSVLPGDRASVNTQGLFGRLGRFFASPFRKILEVYARHMTDEDALIGTSLVGHTILDVTGSVMTIYATYMMAETSTGNMLESLPIIGGIAKSIVGVLSGATFIKALTPIIWVFFLSLFGLGMTLAYYLPAIPFILYTMGAVGTFMIIVTSFIAGPLWAVSHGMFEGEGWAGTHARQGYMLFLTIMLRPSLMVFGLFMSFFLLQAINQYVGYAFINFFNSANEGNYFLFGMLAGLFIVTGLLTAVYHRVFSLITFLPENVPAWIGQLAHRLGENMGSQEVGRTIAVGANLSSQRKSMSSLKPKGREPKIATDEPGDGDGGDGGDDGGGINGGPTGGSTAEANQIDSDLHSSSRPSSSQAADMAMGGVTTAGGNLPLSDQTNLDSLEATYGDGDDSELLEPDPSLEEPDDYAPGTTTGGMPPGMEPQSVGSTQSTGAPDAGGQAGPDMSAPPGGGEPTPSGGGQAAGQPPQSSAGPAAPPPQQQAGGQPSSYMQSIEQELEDGMPIDDEDLDDN